jgi:hypothetical protein
MLLAKYLRMGRILWVFAALLSCQLAACSFPDIPFPGDDDDTTPGVPTSPSVPACNDQLCGAKGGTCRSADGGRRCLLLDAPCGEGQVSACEEDGSHACKQGFVELTLQKACPGQCYEANAVSDGANLSFAFCAIDPAPCRDNRITECRGNLLAVCSYGYPTSEASCDALGEVCRESIDDDGQRHAACTAQ